MKKTIKHGKIYLSVLFIVIVLMCIITISASAEQLGYYTYDVINGEAVITDVDTTINGEVIIPDTLDGYKVTAIGEYAFYQCHGMENVIIPDSITTIGKSAFTECVNLKNIFIPDSVTEIGNNCFQNCSSLESIAIPDSLTSIESWTFSSCDMLKSITIPDSIKTIGESAFAYCKNLTNVDLGNGVKQIGYCAFFDCDRLSCIFIPDGVTEIGERAFYHDESLEEITVDENNRFYSSDNRGALYNKDKTVLLQYPIGNTETIYRIPCEVETINTFALNRCFNLSLITVDEGNQNFTNDSSGVLFNKDKSVLVQYPLNNSQSNYNIPDSVTRIETGSFEDATNLTSIIITDSVTNVGEMAFLNCTRLASIVIPGSITYMSSYIFKNCDSLENVIISDGVEVIGHQAFDSCNKLKNVTISESVTEIKSYAFSDCDNLSEIAIPSSVKTIQSAAFSNCYNLKNITIPKNVSHIGESAFFACDSLTEIIVDEQNMYYTSIDGVLFNKDKTTLVQYPNGKTQTEYTIPHSVKSIGSYAFYDCYNLKKVVIHNGLTHIGNHCFTICNIDHIGYVGSESEWVDSLKNTDTASSINIKYIHYDYDIDTEMQTVQVEPTCTEKGYIGKLCSCGYTEVEKYIDSTGHNFSNIVVTKPTCTEMGYTTYICSCGISYNDNYTDELEHKDSDNDDVCDICDHQIPEKNFFEKIIQFFKNIFEKLFGWLKK